MNLPSKAIGREFLSRLAIIAFAATLSAATASFGQDDVPYWEQEPYDIVKLTVSAGNKEYHVEPLKFPDRVVPANPKPTDKLELHLIDQSDETYEIEWKSIDKIILFEEHVLSKANELISADKPDKIDNAYDIFVFLMEKYPRTAGLEDSYENYLFETAKIAHRNQKYDEALSLLRQIGAKNPKRPGVEKALGVETDKLVEQYVAQHRYDSARTLIQALAKEYPNHPVAAAWSDKLKAQAETFLRESQAAAREGDWIVASEQFRLLSMLWPTLPGAKDFAREMHKNCPRIVVGVTSAPQPSGTNTLADWSARRDRRLLYRTLTEYLAPGMDGGQYLCPVGTCTLDMESLKRRLNFQLKLGFRWAEGDATLTTYDVARRLWAVADPSDPAFCAEWAELLQNVEVQGATTVDVQFRHPHVRPEALLQTVLLPYGTPLAADGPIPTNGPFLLPPKAATANNPAAATAGEERKWTIPPPTFDYTDTPFYANRQYFAAKPTQPKELVQRHFEQSSLAINALKRGDIQVLDRVAPWNLESVKSDPQLALGRYCIPLVHCLIPNCRRPLVSSRSFRRALAYGLKREAILSQLLDGKTVDGCRLVSGPFPMGVTNDDTLNYAYDERIEPRPCDPRIAMMLARVGLKEFTAEEKKKGREVTKMPTLTLAYPDNEIAKTACTSIQFQLEKISIRVDLKPIVGPVPNQIPDDVDLLYAELAMGEPVTDAERLLGGSGLARGATPYVELALKQLEGASDWPKIRDLLRGLHRIVHDDVAVVPLWQLLDFYAYRKNVKGIGEKPFTLYQNLEQWQPPFSYPDGE
jgi:ABC-type transport system substrate-binding protein